MTKEVKFYLLLGAMALLAIGFAYAAVPGGATVTAETDLGEYRNFTAESVDLEAGNITSANLDTNTSTFRWVGLLGNVSGTLVLGDSADNLLFTWTAAGNLVYASEAAGIDWPNVAERSAVQLDADYAYLSGASDSAQDTFLDTANNGELGSNIVTLGGNAAQANTSSGTFATFALYDSTNAANVFAANVSATAVTGFNGQQIQYQMVLPEDGTGANTSATTYYLWVELE